MSGFYQTEHPDRLAISLFFARNLQGYRRGILPERGHDTGRRGGKGSKIGQRGGFRLGTRRDDYLQRDAKGILTNFHIGGECAILGMLIQPIKHHQP